MYWWWIKRRRRAVSYLLLDQFTTAENPITSPRTCEPGPGTLTVQAGTWRVAGGKLEASSDGDLLTSSATAADGTITCVLTPTSSGTDRYMPSLLFRLSDADNFWLVQARADANQWEVYRRESGSFTLMQSIDATVVSGTPYTVRVETSGARWRILVDGVELFSLAWPFNTTATKVGARLGAVGAITAKANWDTLSVSPTVATLPTFTRYGVVVPNATGWEETDVANPDVFWDTPNSRWVMSYSGYSAFDNKWRLGLAYSTDLLHWTKEAANPVFSPTESEGYLACNGSVVVKDGTYYHFYNNGEATGIFVATSPDLLTWTRQNGGSAVITTGAEGAIDADLVADPMVRVMDDGTFTCWYAAQHGVRVYATATSTDGLTWEKQGELFPRATFAPSNPGEPSACLFSGENYSVFCDGAVAADTRFINEAFTLDGGATWRWRGRVLEGSGDGWDSAQVFDSCVVQSGGVTYLFYAGATLPGAAQNLNAQIGLAIRS